MSIELNDQQQNSLERVVRMANLMVAAAQRVEELKQQLDDAKEAHRRIEQEDLPQLMMELGLEAIRLKDGSNLELKPDVQCGISEDLRPAAHAWLNAHGFGGLIKSEVRVAFGTGEIEEAHKLAEEVGGVVNEAVHPATLKSFVKEQLQRQANDESAPRLPLETFAVHPFNKAALSKKKR